MGAGEAVAVSTALGNGTKIGLGAFVLGMPRTRWVIASVCLVGIATAAPSAELASGTERATPVFTLSSGKPGPTVLVVAGIHGDERAPPVAAKRMRSWKPVRGRVVIIPEVNRAALASGTRHSPRVQFPDLNRNFPTLTRRAPRGELAPALWAKLRDLKPDWVLDLHEGWGFNRINKRTMGSSIVVVPDPRVEKRTRPLAKHLVATINQTISRPSRHFTIIEPGPRGSLARSATEVLGIPTFVFETTKLHQPIELRVSQQLLLTRETLCHLDVLRAARESPN